MVYHQQLYDSMIAGLFLKRLPVIRTHILQRGFLSKLSSSELVTSWLLKMVKILMVWGFTYFWTQRDYRVGKNVCINRYTMMWGENITAKAIYWHTDIYTTWKWSICRSSGERRYIRLRIKRYETEFEGNTLMQSYCDIVCVQQEKISVGESCWSSPQLLRLIGRLPVF